MGNGKFQGVILEELHFSLPLRNQESLGNRQKEITELFMLGKVFKVVDSPSGTVGVQNTCWDTDGCCPCLLLLCGCGAEIEP